MNWKDNNVEFILKQDSREKKRAGIGVYKRASRLGYCRGGVRTQSDFLSKKEKDKLNGEVVVYSMYSDLKNVPNLSELKELIIKDPAKAKIILEETKKNFTQNKLREHWGVSAGWLYFNYDKLDVKYEKKSKKSKAKKEPKVKKELQRASLVDVLNRMDITDEEFAYIRKINDLPLNYTHFKMLPDFIDRLQFIIMKYCMTELALILDCTDKQLSGIIYRNNLKTKRGSAMSSVLIKEINKYRKEKKEKKEEYIQEEIKEVIQPQIQPVREEENKLDYLDLKEELDSLKAILVQNKAMLEQKIETKEEIKSGFQIKLVGDMEKEEIETKLLSIAGILMNDKKYKLNLTLEEI